MKGRPMTTAILTNHGTTKIQILHEVIVPGKRVGRHVKHELKGVGAFELGSTRILA